ANAFFTVKRRGVLLAKQPVTVTGTGSLQEVIVNANVTVNDYDELFFDLTARDAMFGSKLALLDVKVGPGLTETVASALHTPAPSEGEVFPQPYRGWGAAGYNGNSPRDVTPVDQ